MAHFFWTVLLPAAALDLLLGDPHWMPHPVRWMGGTSLCWRDCSGCIFPKTPAWNVGPESFWLWLCPSCLAAAAPDFMGFGPSIAVA